MCLSMIMTDKKRLPKQIYIQCLLFLRFLELDLERDLLRFDLERDLDFRLADLVRFFFPPVVSCCSFNADKPVQSVGCLNRAKFHLSGFSAGCLGAVHFCMSPNMLLVSTGVSSSSSCSLAHNDWKDWNMDMLNVLVYIMY